MPLLVAVGTAVWALCHALLVVPRLPQPAPTDDQPTPRYGELVTPGHLIWLAAGSFTAAQVCWLVPTHQWPLWFIYSGAVGTLVGIDALTTYLPKPLHYLCLTELGVAGVCFGAFAGWDAAARAVGGGLIAGVLFYLVWRFSAEFGFGDVRLAFLVGFVAAASSWTMLARALVLGTVIGALWGVVVALQARRRGERPGAFPYGPALWLGPYTAVALSTLTG